MEKAHILSERTKVYIVHGVPFSFSLEICFISVHMVCLAPVLQEIEVLWANIQRENPFFLLCIFQLKIKLCSTNKNHLITNEFMDLYFFIYSFCFLFLVFKFIFYNHQTFSVNVYSNNSCFRWVEFVLSLSFFFSTPCPPASTQL